MKKLTEVALNRMSATNTVYLMLITEDAKNNVLPEAYKGTKAEVIEKLKQLFFYEEWEREHELINMDVCEPPTARQERFLEHCNDINGDDEIYVQLFKFYS